jgi:hypothetical protein
MTMKLVSSMALILGTGALLTACDIEQPSAGCIVQDSTSWIATYTIKENQPTCATTLPAGETVGVFKFTDPSKPDSTPLLTLRPNGLASRATRDPGDPANQTARGSLSAEPDSEYFCTAQTMSEATVDTTTSTTGDKTQIKYAFSNVQVYSHPAAPGTQMRADVTYTRDACTAVYKMNAMWPARPCDPDELAKPENERDLSLLCGPGSLINPDFKVKCHEDLHICVVDGDVPAFKKPLN